MELNGREIGFRRTVYANSKIAEMCPAHDINRINEIFKAKDAKVQLDFAVDFVLAMNEGYEKAKKFNEPDYEPRPLTREELELCDVVQLNSLFEIAADVFRGDAKVTVETAPAKGNRKKKESEPNK